MTKDSVRKHFYLDAIKLLVVQTSYVSSDASLPLAPRLAAGRLSCLLRGMRIKLESNAVAMEPQQPVATPSPAARSVVALINAAEMWIGVEEGPR